MAATPLLVLADAVESPSGRLHRSPFELNTPQPLREAGDSPEDAATGGRVADSDGTLRAQAESRTEIDRLRSVLASQDRLIAEIMASTSWRITGPYRWLGAALKSLAAKLSSRKGRLADHLAQRGGRWLRMGRQAQGTLRALGLKGVLRRLTVIWRAEGMAGVRRRLGRQVERMAAQAGPVAEAGIDYDRIAFVIDRQKSGNRPSRSDAGELRRRNDVRLFSGLGGQPLISVLVPVYNTPPDFLAAAIASVIAQYYPHWELILVDDCSTSAPTREALARYQGRDARIVVVRRAANGHISAASNDGLAAARGEFVALLDHDDVLEPNALLEVARVAKLWPEVDFIYSDEDKLARDGSLHSAYYKPDWSPSLLLSTMYTSHLSVYRTEVVRQAGGFRSEFDGTQDYDLALRMAELTDRVCHIPMILYHWREGPNSTAESLDNKGYAIERQRRALAAALDRRGQRGEVCPLAYPGNWRIRYEPLGQPLVSIIIPSAARQASIGGRTVNLASNCVDSIIGKTTYANYEIILVHNADLGDALKRQLAARDKVRLLEYAAPALNLAEKINQGAKAAAGDYLLILNDDIEIITEDWLETLLGAFAEPDVGIAGAKLFFENGRIQHAGVVWTDSGPTHAFIGNAGGDPGAHLLACLRRDVLGVTGACMMVPRRLFLDAGGYDEKFPLNYNDVDFCLRVREMGYRVVFDPHAQLHHFESISKSGTYRRELDRLIQRWGRIDDPFYNFNYDRSNPFFTAPHRLPHYPGDYEDELEACVVRGRAQAGEGGPAFSFLTTVFNTDPRFLDELAETVFAQTYGNFEWILLDNGSTAPGTIGTLAAIAAVDARVRPAHVERNLGIIGGMQRALQLASGDFVLPLDSDDLLTCDALAIFAAALRQHPGAKLFYSDEDKCDRHGKRFAPFLKPDFDPAYFTNCCYVAHLCCIERASALALGAYGDGSANGCHDWDTFYRFIHAGQRPVHVAAVTYSWRMHPGSTAGSDPRAKPFTAGSQREVLERHFTHRGNRYTHFPKFDKGRGTWHISPCLDRPLAVAMLEEGRRGWSVTLQRYQDGRPQGDRRTLRGLALRQALETAAAQAAYVFYRAPDVKPGENWLEESLSLLTFFSEAAVVGGRIVADGAIVCAGLYAGYRDGGESPFAGLAAGEPGYYGILTALHGVDAVSPLLWAAKSGMVKDALAAGSQGGMGDFLARLYRIAHAAGRTVLYSPRIVGELKPAGQPAPAAGSPIQGLAMASDRPQLYSSNFSPEQAFMSIRL